MSCSRAEVSLSWGSFMSSCEAGLCLGLPSLEAWDTPRLGQIFRHTFWLGAGKAGPAGTSLVEQLGSDMSPGISGSKLRSCSGLLHDLARCEWQSWSLCCPQHHLLSQSCGSASSLAVFPQCPDVGQFALSSEEKDEFFPLPHPCCFPLLWDLAPSPWRGTAPAAGTVEAGTDSRTTRTTQNLGQEARNEM